VETASLLARAHAVKAADLGSQVDLIHNLTPIRPISELKPLLDVALTAFKRRSRLEDRGSRYHS
jgi:hypothetical protein